MDYKKIVVLLTWWFIKRDKKNFFVSVLDALIRIISILIFPLIWILLFSISPLIKIKFIFLYRERLGHLIVNTDFFIREQKVNPAKKTYFLAFCHNPANKTVVEIFSQVLHVINNEYAFKLMSAFGVFENRFRQSIPFAVDNQIRFRVPSPFSFSKSQIKAGDKLFEAMGIRKKNWYVTFHARDNAFDNQISGSNETYNRMASYRNADISKYQGAVSLVLKSGGKAIRVGFPVENAINFKNDSLFDYSLSQFRSDFGDVWICANSRFMVTTANGIAEIPEMFDVPIIMVNTVPIGCYPLGVGSLYLPKTLTDKNGKSLAFSEQLCYFAEFKIAANRFVLDAIHSDGLLLKENTDLQLTNVVNEMLQKLNGVWSPREGYYERLELLNECYQKFGGHGVPLAAMGEDFLFELVL